MNYKPSTMIPLFKVFMASEVLDALKEVLYSGFVAQGPKVDEFEAKLSEFFGNPYVVTLNSGTTALHLALDLIGVGPGDEVITTPMTCTATNWPILAHGATIVWADIDPATGNIDPASIQKRLTAKTKAVMAVDWGGYPCDIQTIKKIVGNIPVIEDAAHAIGAMYKGKMVGNTADYTCFSFQAIKHLTTVDGGALLTKTKKDYKKAILLRYFGIDRNKRSNDYRIEKDISMWGYKFHMNDVNATIGLANFSHTIEILQKHRDNAMYYRNAFMGLPWLTLMHEDARYLSSNWLFTMKVRRSARFMDYMKSHNVMASKVHRRNDTHPVTRAFRRPLPNVDTFYRDMVCIPVGWWVTQEDREYIADLVRSFPG
ncbi:MAG: DegT/DnrJ/EryC1/StrS family aminotransferase [Candidatus Gottesmanbacteria bacterium]|nr:DegT/DnrJ/EryC1/StrS family aminotransferase [Candidatus Gottesmanbacteria bacterium]